MMSRLELLKVIADYRGNAILIASPSPALDWPKVSSTKLEVPFGGCLAKISSYALGLALARPDKKIVVLDGDGSLLMNLGSLVTIAHMAPANLLHFVLENGIYETTGGQPLPRSLQVSFVSFAKAAGYPKTYEFDSAGQFREEAEHIFHEEGPILVCLKVARVMEKAPSRVLKNGRW